MDPELKNQYPLTSGVYDSVLESNTAGYLDLFWIWAGYRFSFYRIRNRIIQMK